MGWYDWFARVYDGALEGYYAEHRQLSAQALRLAAGDSVIDVPCGTGQSFAALTQGVGGSGRIVGVDLSAGMLRQAQQRVRREGWQQVRLLSLSADALDGAILEAESGAPTVNRLHIFLGMTVFPPMEDTLLNPWRLLAPGGRCVIVDVHAERPGVQGHMVNLVARADIRRRFWEPLERVATDFERHDLPYNPKHGGQIMLAAGTKPG